MDKLDEIKKTLNSYDIRFIIQMLEYAKMMKELEPDKHSKNDKFTTKNYDIQQIDLELKKLKGQFRQEYMRNTQTYRDELASQMQWNDIKSRRGNKTKYEKGLYKSE